MGRLFWKIFFAFWLTLLLVAGGVGLVVHGYSQARIERAETLAAGPRAEVSLAAVATTLRHSGREAARALLRAWHGSHISPVMVVDAEGRELLGRRVAPAVLAGARQRIGGGESAPGVRRVVGVDGEAYLLFIPTDIVRHGRQPATAPLASRLAVVLLASLLFSGGLAWYLVRPVRRLRAAHRSLAAGRLETRVAPAIGRRQDEIADLGRDFDHMAGRLQALVEAQQRLLHDVSHELRSPLARLEVAVGLARQRPERSAAVLDRIEREIHRLDGLVGEVLTLSRMEAGVHQEGPACLELAELLAAVAEDARFEAQGSGRELRLTVADESLVMGRAELLRRALENVIRNALHHTAAGSKVEVSLQTAGGQAVVTVCDRGPGVPERELGRLFEPFFRTAGSGEGGYGLGLAIARRAVDAHAGTIRAYNREGDGLCVELSLPLVDDRENAIDGRPAIDQRDTGV